MFLLSQLKERCLNPYYRRKNAANVKRGAWQPRIMTLEETLKDILDNHLSISRFGDGEFKWMMGIKQQSFQNDDAKLRELLTKTFALRDKRLLLCIPDTFGDLSQYNAFAINYWSHEMYKRRNMIQSLIPDEYIFGNSNITRFYMDYLDKGHVETILGYWKSIFYHRNIYIVEGEFSRLGVGNDLFSTASSVHRILAPAKNAFSSYQKILSFVKENVPLEQSSLILFALGPTATIMVPFLVDAGYQALDIGHIDVEYEWYKLHATKKIPLVGRYVNEAGGFIEEFNSDILKKYDREIMAKIDC